MHGAVEQAIEHVPASRRAESHCVTTVGRTPHTSCVELVASGASSGAKPRMTSDRQSDVCTAPCHVHMSASFSRINAAERRMQVCQMTSCWDIHALT